MDEGKLIETLRNETGPVSIQKEILDDIETTPERIKSATGRDFEIETIVSPDPAGGLPFVSEIVRFFIAETN